MDVPQFEYCRGQRPAVGGPHACNDPRRRAHGREWRARSHGAHRRSATHLPAPSQPGYKPYPALLMLQTFLTGGEWPALPPPS